MVAKFRPTDAVLSFFRRFNSESRKYFYFLSSCLLVCVNPNSHSGSFSEEFVPDTYFSENIALDVAA